MILTGSYAGKNGIISGTWWNLLGKKPRWIKSDKASVGAIRKYNKKLLNPECKTLFEYFENSASFHAVNRGADFKFLKNFRILTSFLPLLIEFSKSNEPGAVSPIARPDLNRKLLSKYIIRFLKDLEKRKPLFDASFIVFLLTDANAHKFGYDSKEYREAIQILDLDIKLLIEGGEDLDGNTGKGLKELGYLDNIVWNIHTDHSGRRIIRDKFIMLDSILQIEGGLSIVEGEDTKKNIKEQIKDVSKINAFSASGSEDSLYWFGNNSGNLEDFNRFYGEKFFTELPTLSQNVRYKPEKFNIIDFLKNKPYIQFLLIPEDEEPYVKPTSEFMKNRISMKIPRKYNIKIISLKGKALLKRLVKDDDIYYRYNVLEGEDPLNYVELGISDDKPISADEVLEKSIKSENPDAFHRLFAPFDCITAPNLIITSSFDYHFWHKNTVFENELRNVQTHGGLYNVESIVPVTFAGPGIKNAYEIPYGRNIDILPTLLEIMGVKYDSQKIDGKPFMEILDPVDERRESLT